MRREESALRQNAKLAEVVEQHAQAEATVESLRQQLADASAGGADAQSLLRQQLADASASAQRAQPGGLAWVSALSPRFPEPGQCGANRQRGRLASWSGPGLWCDPGPIRPAACNASSKPLCTRRGQSARPCKRSWRRPLRAGGPVWQTESGCLSRGCLGWLLVAKLLEDNLPHAWRRHANS